MSSQYERLCCVVLAAGLSRRSGKANKLLVLIDEMPMVRKVVEALVNVEFGRVVVVLGHESDLVKAALSELDLDFVVNVAFEDGMGSSLAAGVRALDENVFDGVLVCLADLPWLEAEDVASVCDAFLAKKGQQVVVPEFEGVRGHPVAFPRRMLAGLKTLQGDEGAKKLIAQEEMVVALQMQRTGCIRDLDDL